MQIVKALAESLATILVESSAAAQKRDFLPNRNFNDSRFLFLQISFLLPLSQRAIFKKYKLFFGAEVANAARDVRHILV